MKTTTPDPRNQLMSLYDSFYDDRLHYSSDRPEAKTALECTSLLMTIEAKVGKACNYVPASEFYRATLGELEAVLNDQTEAVKEAFASLGMRPA
jgi:hypothetical protein